MMRAGFVALVGRPNVGKSTLLNRLVGYRVAAIASKPQTTRSQIRGIVTQDDAQLVFVDTPGLHEDAKTLLNRSLNAAAVAALEEVDVVALLVEAGRFTAEDEYVLQRLKHLNKPLVLVINKVDRLKSPNEVLGFIDSMQKRHDFAEIVPLSAQTGANCDELVKALKAYLPESELLFPEDQITDKSVRFIVGELIREQVMQRLHQEIPYSVAVEVEAFDEQESLVRIGAVIWVERDGQKGIVIGKKGQMLKAIGSGARAAIEDFLEQKVYLRLWVKVSEDWQNDPRRWQQFGVDAS
jgi:GTP-binding protein Era